MKTILVSGTEGKRALAEYICDGLDGAWLVELAGPGGVDAFESEPSDVERQIEALVSSGTISESDVVVVVTNRVVTRPEPELTVFLMDAPQERLEASVRQAGRRAEIILVELGPQFESVGELGLERELKAETGAGKVLIFDCEESRSRAFRKVLDVALSRVGGGKMPEEIPDEVMEAVKREGAEGKIPCARAQELAGELGVPIPVVGRALDLLNIKIIQCQLGCF